jgi:shikimate kinase
MAGHEPSPRHLVLVGMMGAGKTSVGQRCAQLLGRPFLDTDELVEANTRMGVADIFAEHGEARFRSLERDAVHDACASPDPLVIACGGGAVLDADNRRELRDHGVVVWLQAPVEVLGARVAGPEGAARPLLGGADAPDAPTATLARLFARRAPVYEAAAEILVDTEGRSVDQVADVVVEEFRAWNG